MTILTPPPPPMRTTLTAPAAPLQVGDIVYVRARVTGMPGDWIHAVELMPVDKCGTSIVAGSRFYCHEIEVMTAQELKDELRG